MPQEPTIVYHKDTGEPAMMHSIDAGEALRLGDYVSAPPEGKGPDKDPEALSRARARFMGGDVAQAELKSPEQRAEDTRVANAMEAQRTGQPAPVVTPVVAATPRATKADKPEGESPTVSERHPASGRAERS